MKRLLVSGLISLIVNVIGLVINYTYFLSNNTLMMAYKIHGGEITSEFGFGLKVNHIYSMLPNGNDTTTISFSIIIFIIGLLLIGFIAYIMITIKDNLFRRFYV